jgi:hypothetical protein
MASRKGRREPKMKAVALALALVACVTHTNDKGPHATLEARLASQYCKEAPAPWIVVVYTDDQGIVGGYRAGMALMDSPVSYFRADGTPVGIFHVFADPAENAKHKPAIDELHARFPHERPFTCH